MTRRIRRFHELMSDARVIVACIVAIGLLATLAIEQLQRTAMRADQALEATTRLRVIVERYGQIELFYELNPNQPFAAYARFLSVDSAARDQLHAIAAVAPGAEHEALVIAYEHLSESVSRANQVASVDISDVMVEREYVASRVVPAGVAFNVAVSEAERVYGAQSERGHEIARFGSVLLILVATTAIVFLVAVMERMRRSVHDSLARKETRFRALVEHGTDLITVIDAEGRISYQSDSIGPALGFTADALAGAAFVPLVAEHDRDAFAALVDRVTAAGAGAVEVEILALLQADGQARSFEITAANHLDKPEIGGILLNAHDVTEQLELNRQLRHQALHDPLTSLPNRQLFRDRLETAIARAARSGTGVGVIFIDLDGFKSVNDDHGHAAGDSLLRALSGRLVTAVRTADTVARIGGDEFVVLLENVDRQTLERVTDRIRAAIARPFPVAGRDLEVVASIGMALRTDPATSADELLRQADHAMYAEKRSSRDDRRVIALPAD